MVAVAASAGVLRFGFSESTFSRANEDLAALGGRVGLPIAGYSLLKTLHVLPPALNVSPFAALAVLLINNSLIASMGRAAHELANAVLNLCLFVIPLGLTAWRQNDLLLAAGVTLFAATGLVVGNDRHRCLFGIRRENIFHYGLGSAAVVISSRLVAM